ncbi:MAG: TIGR02466 family protein [Trueperaceae bacterium]
MSVQFLFPTPLLQKKLDNHATINAELVKLFYNHRQEDGDNDGNVYSSDDDLLIRYNNVGALKDLFNFISQGVFEAASSVNQSVWQHLGSQRLNMNVVGAWFQIQNNYGFHDIHNHGNCSWSGVYYVQIDDAAKRDAHPVLGKQNGITRFYSHQLNLLGGAHMDLGNAYLQRSNFDVVPEEGGLIVFPSWLNHKALPYDGEKDRVIISFNMQVHGEKGNKAFNHGF